MSQETSWFGIDFGTTNSAVVSITGEGDNIQHICFGDEEGRPFPSVIAIGREDGSILSGREAKERHNALLKTHEYISSIKSILDSGKEWNIAGIKWTAVDVAAEIFMALKRRVEREGNQILENAFVAVPVGFSAENRKCLREAAQKAGVTVSSFVSEPTAALCSNIEKLKGCRNVAVFDWGGGTLDVVIARIEGDTIEEIASRRLDLAGNHIDIKFAERIHSRFMRDKENAVSFDKLDAITRDQLISRCETAKCHFCDDDTVRISLNRYADYGPVGTPFDYDHFELLVENVVNQAIECLQLAIQSAGLNSETLDRILCVGGSSRLRPLRERLEKLYGEDMLLFPEKVMWDIAKGAAQLAYSPGNYTLSRPLGTLLADNSFFPLIKAGTTVPAQEEHLRLRIVDGNAPEACLVMTDGGTACEQTFLEPFRFKLRGFHDEVVELSYYIDKDSVFWLTAGSNRTPASAYKVWSYEKPALLYHLDRSKIS